MIYEITYAGEGKGKKKMAHPVKDRAALMAKRDSKKNLGYLTKARNGDAKAKAKLMQLAARASAATSSTMWTAMMPNSRNRSGSWCSRRRTRSG